MPGFGSYGYFKRRREILSAVGAVFPVGSFSKKHYKAIERAQRWMSSLTAQIISNAGHLLIMDQPEIINVCILNFLGTD